MDSSPQDNPAKPKTRIPLKLEEMLAGIAIGILGLITFANVVVRYLTNFSFAFTEEFSVFLMLFMALVGGSSVMAKQGHLNIRYLVDKLAPKTRHWTLIGATVLTALTFLLLAIFGARMAWDEYRFEVTSPGLGLPTWIYTVWLPLLSLAIFGRTVGVLIRMWRSRY
jgi:TRAP-type C4-dicarboxylate transport system permease small subunit